MVSARAAASGSASTVSTEESALSSSTTHIDWGSKGWTFSLYVRESSWELFPLCFDSLVQLILVVCCTGIIFMFLSYGTLAILLGFNIVSSLGFTVIFVRMLTWGSRQSLYSLPGLGITWSCSEYLFIGSSWLVWYDVGLLLFHRRSDGLIVDNVEISFKLYCIMC